VPNPGEDDGIGLRALALQRVATKVRCVWSYSSLKIGLSTTGAVHQVIGQNSKCVELKPRQSLGLVGGRVVVRVTVLLARCNPNALFATIESSPAHFADQSDLRSSRSHAKKHGRSFRSAAWSIRC
jgi:hypothetical protein